MRVDGKIITEAFGSLQIQNDSVALLEQIKNAIDAGATEINFDFSKIPDNNQIIITENGSGMNKDKFEYEWNTIGDSSKSNDKSFLGGKGIGRFTLFRLSDDITILTKDKNSTPCRIILNNKDFTSTADLSQYEIKASTISKEEWEKYTSYNTGTIYILDNIERSLNYTVIQRDLETVNIPFSKKTITIDVKLPAEVNKSKFKTCDEASIYAPFNLTAIINNGKFEKCKCIVRDVDGNERSKLTEHINLDDLNSKIIKRLINEDEDINVPESCLAELDEIKIYIDSFYFDHKYNRIGKYIMRDIQDNFLSAYLGINIYRNNVKIYGFGRNDFLKLAEKRLKRSDENFDNKQTFGYVSISQKTKNILKEQTNREGFIIDNYYKAFTIFLDEATNVLGEFRNNNKTNLFIPDEKPIKAKYLTIIKENQLEITERKEEYVKSLIQDNIKNIIQTNISFEDINIEMDFSKYSAEILTPQNILVKLTYTEDPKINTMCVYKLSVKRKRAQKEKALLYVEHSILDSLKIKNKKLSTLFEELTSLNINQYPNASSLLYRAILEISFNLYIIKYMDKYSLNLIYDGNSDDIKTKNESSLKTDKRVDFALDILKDENPKLSLVGKAKIIKDGIKEINFVIHKNSNFAIPQNLINFQKNVEEILMYILKDICE